jgi:hypothetical protein
MNGGIWFTEYSHTRISFKGIQGAAKKFPSIFWA